MSTPTTGWAGARRRLTLAVAITTLVVVALTAFLLGRASRGGAVEERDSFTGTLTELRVQSHGLAYCVRHDGDDVCGLAAADPAEPMPARGDRVRVTPLALRTGKGSFVVSLLQRAP